MTYLDGSTVRVGDLVWWDDERGLGCIIDIYETQEQCASWGLEEPGVAICYDGSGAEGLKGRLFIGYPRRVFAEEGIRRLTKEEEAEVNRLMGAAQRLSHDPADDLTNGLFRRFRNGRETWNVVFYRNHTADKVIEVDPSDYSCREIPLKESGIFYDLAGG